MKTITLSKSGIIKLKKGYLPIRLEEKDCADLSRSFIPGEWVQFHDDSSSLCGVGFVNIMAEKPSAPLYLLELCRSLEPSSDSVDEENFATGFIKRYLDKAIKRRERFFPTHEGRRLIYGENDQLPGLIIDQYDNCLLIQIQTAGLDRFRHLIASYFIEKNFNPVFYDDVEGRKSEGLPLYETSSLTTAFKNIEKIIIKENNFTLTIPSTAVQKLGYYYDHRLNRLRGEKLIKDILNDKNKKKGLDLFCYVGSWGYHQLRAGIEKVTFVDQGRFASIIEENIKANQLKGDWEFISKNAFTYLDEQLKNQEAKTFDVISSDPPAFVKNPKDKLKALQGYLRLHQKLMKLIAPQGLLIINSCTKYVNFEELDKTVSEAAAKEQRKIHLIDIGLQAPDHPMRSLTDKGHYLKYLAYFVED